MEIRSLRPDEAAKVAALYMNAYRIGRQTADEWISAIDFSNTRAFVDEVRALSLIQIIPFHTMIGGRFLSMGGIGGVATWADQQGHGFAGRLMAYSIEEMRRLGHSISFLYPFSHRYYGKFGWAMAAQRVVYRDIEKGLVKAAGGNADCVRAVVRDVDFDLLKSVYDKALADTNCLIVRDERLWRKRREHFARERVQAYLIEGEAGVGGYFVCEDAPIPGQLANRLKTVVSEFVCPSSREYSAMFGFLRTLPANVHRLEIVAPDQPCLWEFFVEPFVETRLEPGFQARVIDVKAACEGRGYPTELSAEVDFAVEDPLASWNSGNWRLSVKEGTATIENTAAESTLRLSIQEFSAIFVGFLDPTTIARYAQHPQAAILRSVFHDKPTRILDFF